MTFEITIKPSEHSVPCDDGETVLAAAMRADLMLPYGCRNGACGTCKGKILSGQVDYGTHQASTLTAEEKRMGLALFCCAKPLTDLVDRGARGAPRRRHPDQAAARAASSRSTRWRPTSRSSGSSCPANERLQYPRGPVRRFPAEGRQAAQLLARHAAARRRAARAPRPAHPGRLLHPTRCSRSTRAARSCASRGRSARSTCARNRTSR